MTCKLESAFSALCKSFRITADNLKAAGFQSDAYIERTACASAAVLTVTVARRADLAGVFVTDMAAKTMPSNSSSHFSSRLKPVHRQTVQILPKLVKHAIDYCGFEMEE
jgi:hypothetical protein